MRSFKLVAGMVALAVTLSGCLFPPGPGYGYGYGHGGWHDRGGFHGGGFGRR